MDKNFSIHNDDCMKWVQFYNGTDICLTFLDPPFNQGKDYRCFDDFMPDEMYWSFIGDIISKIYDKTVKGGAIYFMQREKNTEYVLKSLRETGWVFQNLIIWRKKTSAVPCSNKFGKQYQIIAYATKSEKPRIFNRLRISPPLPPTYKFERENGLYVTDVWDDIRELTSGYLAGDEALRNLDGTRFHKQQTPISLLLRIILSSTKVNDIILDPFAGTGTTLVTATQLNRFPIGIEIDKENFNCIKERLKIIREADNVSGYYKYYANTENLDGIWGSSKKDKDINTFANNRNYQIALF